MLQVFTCLARSSRAGQHRPQLSRRSSSRSPSALTGQQSENVLATVWAISFPCPPTFWLSCFLSPRLFWLYSSFLCQQHYGHFKISLAGNILSDCFFFNVLGIFVLLFLDIVMSNDSKVSRIFFIPYIIPVFRIRGFNGDPGCGSGSSLLPQCGSKSGSGSREPN